MFICTSPAHPCASVARFSPKFQVPLTDFCYASSFNRPAGTGSKNYNPYNDSKNSNYPVVRWLGNGKTVFPLLWPKALHRPSETDTRWCLKGALRISAWLYILSGNRCIFASMLKCTSLARPCASVAYYQTKFQVPLASIIRYPRSGEQYSVFCQTLERLFLSSKEKLVS